MISLASTTPNLGLYKKNPLTDGSDTFNIETMLNQNWDKIDQEIGEQQQSIDAHSTEDSIHVAGGTANAITITTGQSYSYGQHKRLSFKATANSTGNVTINVDGKGVVPALKFDGSQLPAGAIKSGKVYDWYYDTASGGRFFLIAKASGNAVAGDVLAGKTASGDDGEFTGTIPNNGAGGTVTPGTSDIVKPSGYYSSPITIKGDPELVAANIKEGIDILGVIGTLPVGKKQLSGTVTSSNTSQLVVNSAGNTTSLPWVTVTGLSFSSKPYYILVYTSDGLSHTVYDMRLGGQYSITSVGSKASAPVGYSLKEQSPISVSPTGFTLPIYYQNSLCYWVAIEG